MVPKPALPAFNTGETIYEPTTLRGSRIVRNGAFAVLMMLIGLTALGGCVVHDHRDGAVSVRPL